MVRLWAMESTDLRQQVWNGVKWMHLYIYIDIYTRIYIYTHVYIVSKLWYSMYIIYLYNKTVQNMWQVLCDSNMSISKVLNPRCQDAQVVAPWPAFPIVGWAKDRAWIWKLSKQRVKAEIVSAEIYLSTVHTLCLLGCMVRKGHWDGSALPKLHTDLVPLQQAVGHMTHPVQARIHLEMLLACHLPRKNHLSQHLCAQN